MKPMISRVSQWAEVLDDSTVLGKFSREIAKEAVIFNCGSVDNLPKWSKKAEGIIRPPYPVTIFEIPGYAESQYIVTLLVLFDADSKHCEEWQPKNKNRSFAIMWAQKGLDGKWRTTLPALVEFPTEDSVSFIYHPENRSSVREKEILAVWARIAAHIFNILRCVNIETKDNPAPAALNKKRIAHGKVPLYSFKTLHIKVPNERSASTPQGGTHASPRVHLRRGHIRHLVTGKDIWVQPCVVGSKTGMVEKDYALVVA